MGANLCKSKNIKRDAEFYYKTVNVNELDNSAKEKVRLTISILKPQYTKYQATLYLYQNKLRANYQMGGQTEEQEGNGANITFTHVFIMEYYFEKEQHVGFNVRIGSSSTLVQTTLGSIMGARGQKYHYNLSNGAIFEISGKSLESNNLKGSFNVTATGNYTGIGLTFLIKNMGTQTAPSNAPVYRSELREGMNSITFDKIDIPLSNLVNSSNYAENFISIEVYDMYKNLKLGEKMASFGTLMADKTVIDCKNGRTVNVKATIVKEYLFLDYLRGGMQIALTIGIDFTGSNFSPNDPKSLHNVTTSAMNSYEKAIKSCGDIVAYYDYDQLFPVFGYGAILPGQTAVNHCFPITMTEDPNINTIDGVLKCYRNILPTLRFYGPSYCAPIIRTLNNQVKSDLQAGNTMQYNILMILTDGQINDMNETIDELVEASYLPISVIIIGVGHGGFGNMDILDADEEPLFDKNHRKAARDLVQFVPFFKYQNDGEKLAEQVLEEVPRQVCEYYQQNNIIPSDPIIPLAG